MKFEYDSNKSASNRQKHGIDFEEAQLLWAHDNVMLSAMFCGEPRFMILGMVGSNGYACIFTVRHDCIRLISARRWRRKERNFYYEKIKEADKR